MTQTLLCGGNDKYQGEYTRAIFQDRKRDKQFRGSWAAKCRRLFPRNNFTVKPVE